LLKEQVVKALVANRLKRSQQIEKGKRENASDGSDEP
jgi:hypothetical protein